MFRYIAILVCLIVSATVPAGLAAHPHMWIRGRLVPEMGKGGLEAVRVTWQIDELTSSPLILDYDTDRDGTFSERELMALKKSAFDDLLESEYYLRVEVGNRIATPVAAAEFQARIEKGRIIYDFRVPLAVPIRWGDMTGVRLFLFDQSYFIDFRPEDISGMTVGYQNTEVTFRKTRTRSMTLGYGMVEITGLEAAEVGPK